MINRSDMHAIGGLSDLRAYLRSQEIALTEILIEELHNHLYLKSPYCQDRWKEESHQSLSGRDKPSAESVAIPPSPRRTMQAFISSVDMSKPMVEDASRSPESDTFYYIRLLLESLGNLGVLDIAVKEIEQRMPVELYRIVDRTSQEVDRRHPSSTRGNPRHGLNQSQVLPAEENARAVVMQDLLGTLYAKLEAVAEAHRVLHDVISGLTQRSKLRYADVLTGGFRELWKLYQSEIRTILHDYLATDAGSAISARNSTSGQGATAQRSERDRGKRVFRLNDMDIKSPGLALELSELDTILKNSVPGLLSDSRRQPGTTVNEQRVHVDGSATGGRLLIDPSVFNMSLLLPPSLAFLVRLKEIIPPDSEITVNMLTSFLDDFLTNVFQPQLDETLAELSSRIFNDPAAFQLNPRWTAVAKRPILRAASAMYNLIVTFCKMLDALPPDQAFSQLIIDDLVAFYDRCYAAYKSLISDPATPSAPMKLAADYADREESRKLMEKLLESEGANAVANDQEVSLMLKITEERPLTPSDLLPGGGKTIESLCLLYNSLLWLADQASSLRHISSSFSSAPPLTSSLASGGPQREPLSAGLTPRSSSSQQAGPHWTDALPTRSKSRAAGTSTSQLQKPYLPLTASTAPAFDSVLTSLRALATTILYTLHADIRLLTIQQLTLALSAGSYHLDASTADASPQIKSLAASYVSLRRTYIQNLPAGPRAFVSGRLGPLVTAVLVGRAKLIPVMNRAGAERMALNLLVLQQNLKNSSVHSLLVAAARARSAQHHLLLQDGNASSVSDPKAVQRGAAAAAAAADLGADLSRASSYYALFGEGGAKAAEALIGDCRVVAERLGVGYEELKAMVELCYSEGVGGMDRKRGGREGSLMARRGLGEALLRLSEEMWNA